MKKFLFSILFFVLCMLTAYHSNAQTRVDPAASDDDADIPSFIKNKPAKDAYLKAREDNINTIRGLPWTLPYNPRVKAITEMKIQEQKNAFNRSFLVQSPNWVELGPSPIPNGQTQGVVNAVSGRTVCIAIHPTNPSIVYVGTANGGIYRTVDGGTNWTQIFDGGQSLSIGALAISPSNPSTLFVGTGEADLSADSYAGVGLYRIDNADVAPSLVGPINPLVTTGIANTTAFSARAISKILVDPADGNNIYVSTTSAQIGNPGSSPSGTIPIIALKGIYRSTNALSTLGSIAFTKLTVTATGSVAPDITGNTNVTDMVMEPGNPDNITCWVYGFTSEGGIWHTTNATAVTPTFTQTQPIGANIRGSFAIVQQGSGPSSVVLYAATGESASGTSCTTGSGAVRKSRDGGVTWSAKLPGGGGFCGGQCFYDLPIAVSPVDSLTLLLGGSALGTCSAIMKRSTDASATFIDKGNGLHADEHVIAFAPSDATIAYTGNDGGIFKSTTGGTTWNSMNTAGFSATQFQSIAVHPTNTSLTIGGTQDNGTNAIKSDNSPFRVDFGDGGYAAIDQNGGAVNATIMYHTYFNQTNNQIGFASTILGETATEGSPSWKLYGCGGTANGIACSDATLFYAPLVLGPGSPVNNVYFGTNKLYRSVDTGIVMSAVSQTMATTISSIAISKQNDNVRIVGLSNGNVFATVTGVSPLIAVSPPFAAARAVGRVAIDPTNADVAYVTYVGAYGLPLGQRIWKTSNLSAATPTWTASGTGIPDVPVNAFAIDPGNSQNVFAGTDIGVYSSVDAGLTWSSYSAGLPIVPVFDMVVHPVSRVLKIATHGRGFWQTTLGVLPVTFTSFTATARKNGKAYLEWYTASEYNNKGFELQVALKTSVNPVWKNVAFVTGSGTSTTPRRYGYEDAPTGGKKYLYRIKQIDLDGNFKYSEIREVELKDFDFGVYQNYPNPAANSTLIKYQVSEDANVSIILYNNLGEKIKVLVNEKKEAGIYQLEVNTSSLPVGKYYYKLVAGDFYNTKQLMISK